MKGQDGGAILVSERSHRPTPPEEEVMFTTLPESRAPHIRRVGGTVTSALVHGALIAAAVAATIAKPMEATPGPKADTVIIVIARPPQPRRTRPDPSVPRPGTRGEGSWPGPIIVFKGDLPDLPPIDPSGPVIPEDSFARGGAGKGIPEPGFPGAGGLGTDGIIDAPLADRSPRMTGRPIVPRYPASLRGAGIEGRVVLQFVIDTLGRAEAEGVQVLESTHALFTEAVREVLPRVRFSPGEAGGRKVRTRVMMPFAFTIAR
jgi:protein TonB